MNDSKRIEQIFDDASSLPPGAERESRVAGACSGDAALRKEVESLLTAHERCGRFLEGGATVKVESQPPPHPSPVQTVDPVPRISGFTLRRMLGQGGLGTVYEAWDEKLQRATALKVLRAQAGADLRPRMLNEARRAAAVRDPAIVTIYSVLDDSDPPAIVMELVSGYPIDQFSQNLTFEQKARLLQEVARGLSVAHAQGLIHRDLKPDNVLVGPDMKPKILDFGLAVPLDEMRGGLGYFEGSPLFASPEQAAGKPLSAASDVFSFGSMMFKVLTGQPPFPGASVEEVLRAIATTRPPFLRNLATGTPEDLQAICLACLSWHPADRPSAAELVVELGRYLAGEPVHLKPKLYDDILRQRISEYSTEAQTWESQSMISRDERDSLEVIHRRMLADEDHWIIDARRLTLVQTALYAGSWLMVVSAALMVWMLRTEMGWPWRWLAPMLGTASLLALGWVAERRREPLASASFLAGAALSIAPSTLACLAEAGVLAQPALGVKQLLDDFTNQQVLAASVIALLVSILGLARLKMTGFAWTTAVLGIASYMGVLLQFNWLEQKPEIQALWCLPLAAIDPVALAFERVGRVRWTLPFHLVSLLALVVGLDVMAGNHDRPTLQLLGVTHERWAYFDDDRQLYLSIVLNGALFLVLMLLTERAPSLDLRRGSKVLEIIGILHTLGPLFANAYEHRGKPFAGIDVTLYLIAAMAFLATAPWRSRWRLLVGGLAGMGFGSYLLIHLDLVAKKPFVVWLGAAGFAIAVFTYAYLRRAARPRGR